MAISSADDADDDVGAQQSKKYRPAVGCKLPESIIDEVLEIALAAQVPRIYDSYSDIPVPWTHLTTPRWNQKVSALVDLWADCEDNVRRAEACVGRPALKTGKDLVRIFGLFELRERLDSKDWIPVPGGLGDNATSAQTVVFVALTDLTPANGFFMTLKKGEDICLDSNADIRFPAPGGGLGVSFVLEL